MKVKSESEVAQSCPTLRDPMDCGLPGSSVHDFPGKSTGVGCHCLLQEIQQRREKESDGMGLRGEELKGQKTRG